MLDLLLDALGALLGLDGGGEEAPSTARQARPRQQQSPQQARQPQQRPQAMSLEDMLRKMMGGGEEPAPPPRRTNPVRVPPVRQQPAAPVRKSAPPPAPVSAQKPSVIAPAAAAAATATAASAPGHDFLDALRTNPDAARQAFVYSEIFGAPLADRQKETLW